MFLALVEQIQAAKNTKRGELNSLKQGYVMIVMVTQILWVEHNCVSLDNCGNNDDEEERGKHDDQDCEDDDGGVS